MGISYYTKWYYRHAIRLIYRLPGRKKGEQYMGTNKKTIIVHSRQKDRSIYIGKRFADKWASFAGGISRYPMIATSLAAQTAPLSKRRTRPAFLESSQSRTLIGGSNTDREDMLRTVSTPQRVRSIISPVCDCGWDSQTAKQIIRQCRRQPHRRRMLEKAGTTDHGTLITTPKGLKIVTTWLMKLCLLSQFSLAMEQLYQ